MKITITLTPEELHASVREWLRARTTPSDRCSVGFDDKKFGEFKFAVDVNGQLHGTVTIDYEPGF